MSKWYGVHNDEDEVAYAMDKPKVRYENKQARCRLSKLQNISTIGQINSSTNTTFLSIVKGRSFRVSILRLKKR